MNLTRWRDTGLRFEFKGHSIFYQQQSGQAPGQAAGPVSGAASDTGERPALLLIHGYPTSSWDWSGLWAPLQARFGRLIAADMLGFGFSDKPPRHAYSLMEQADLQEALLDHLGVRKVHVLAHDYGVSVAQELLARSAEGRGPRLLSVTLLNGGLFPETHRATVSQRLLRSPLGGLMARLMNQRRFERAFCEVFAPQTRPSTIELHDFWTLVSGDGGARALRRLIRYIDERRRHRERWVGALTATSVPIRLINGPVDPVSGAHMVARYRELVPNPDVVSLDGIGHYPQLEAPDRTLRAFFEFHDGLDAR